jgi:fluoroquinolone resistance protein
MQMKDIEDKTYDNIDFTEVSLAQSIFINCVFTFCTFIKSDLSYTNFEDCTFNTCIFSETIVNSTRFKNVLFNETKMMGFNFSNCKEFLFELIFKNCPLDYAIFIDKKMRNTIFEYCSLKEVDFTKADLTMTTFGNCDLQNAIFEETILEKADFRTAINFNIDPQQNKIKKAKFSYIGLGGLLTKYGLDIEY